MLSKAIVYREGLIALAIAEKKRDRTIPLKELARRFNIPATTLRNRNEGMLSRKDSDAKKHKLTEIEEDTLEEWIIYQNMTGYPPRHCHVREMANCLLAGRGTQPPEKVGVNWLTRYLNRNDVLLSKVAKPLDYVRAKGESPEDFEKWFKSVKTTIDDLGIVQDDVYNFDETGFAMGALAATKVITASEARDDVTIIQPGNREWVTTIECISAGGFALPPFIIFKCSFLQKGWSTKVNLSLDSRIGVSENGWSNNTLCLSWLEFIFIPLVQKRRQGKYVLLLLDGHVSHMTLAFSKMCEENLIKILCLPPHLQPLDLVCFSVLKGAYRKLVDERMRMRVHSIDKYQFLSLYPQARREVFEPKLISSAFKAAGIYPYDKDYVISKLPSRVLAPPPEAEVGSPKGPTQAPACQITPSKSNQVNEISNSIQRRIQNLGHGVRSPLQALVSKFTDIAHSVIQSLVVIAREWTHKNAALEFQLEKKARPKRKYIKECDLSIEQMNEYGSLSSVAQNLGEQNDGMTTVLGSPGRKRKTRLCRNCKNPGHNIQTCPTKLQ